MIKILTSVLAVLILTSGCFDHNTPPTPEYLLNKPIYDAHKYYGDPIEIEIYVPRKNDRWWEIHMFTNMFTINKDLVPCETLFYLNRHYIIKRIKIVCRWEDRIQ